MKKITVLSGFILLIIALSVSLFYSSCKKDACKDLDCKNGGMCMDGTCMCAAGFQGVDCSTVTPVKKTYKVSYEIGCTDCEVIYYKDSLQTQATEDHKNNSWTYTFYAKKGQEALLFAYNTSSMAQGITATIKLNDSIVATQTNYCQISANAFVVDSIQ